MPGMAVKLPCPPLQVLRKNSFLSSLQCLGFETPVKFKVIKTDLLSTFASFPFETPVKFKVIKTRLNSGDDMTRLRPL